MTYFIPLTLTHRQEDQVPTIQVPDSRARSARQAAREDQLHSVTQLASNLAVVTSTFMDPPSPLKGSEVGLQKYQANDPYYDHTEWTGREVERDSSLLYFSKLSYMEFCRYMDEATNKPTGILD